MKSWETVSTDELSSAYLQRIYRRKGWYQYVEREVSLAPTAIAPANTEGVFLAEFLGISKQGELLLRHQTGEEKSYHFKQIRFVL